MANKNLFASGKSALLPPTNTRNQEGAPAYLLKPEHALAQYAATGCFGRTFYADAKEQLDSVLALCEKVRPEFVAQVAVYSRKQAYLKDMPALLCAWLSSRDPRLHEAVFWRVIDNVRMLRNYVQILRSGTVGRRSLGSAPKRLVRQWLASQDVESLFRSSTGQSPSFADVLKMVHPKPADPAREAFYGYMLGRPFDREALPALVAAFESFKAGETLQVPELPFTMLSALPLSAGDWAEVAQNATWQTTRMNLNTFARHGVFTNSKLVEILAQRLRDPREIAKARVFPYQLLAAFQNSDTTVPAPIREALQDAMELAIQNVPAIQGKVVVCPDVSGSMQSPVTGYRTGSSSAVRCIDVAALVGAAVLRKNPDARILPFAQAVVPVDLNPRDSVMTNATRLAAIGGGGTSCSAPLRLLNQQLAYADLVILVSDNESWVDAQIGRGTALMAEWARFRQRNRQARLVCLDIQPKQTTQAAEREDILNIGGFSDRVFEVISAFATGELEAAHWVGKIKSVVL